MRFGILAFSVLAAVSGFAIVESSASAVTTTNFNVTATGMSAYIVDGVNNPTLTLTKGQSYTFAINTGFMFHPFYIATAPGKDHAQENAYSSEVDVLRQGAHDGVVTFNVPPSAPATLYYQCGVHDEMGGVLKIVPAATAPAPAPTLGTTALAALAGLLMLVATLVLRKRAQA